MEPIRDLEPSPLGLSTTPCAWCFDPSIETVTVSLATAREEVDLCARHLAELLEGSREAP